MTQSQSTWTADALRWPFPARDSFASLHRQHHLSLIDSLPGMIVWPIVLVLLAAAAQLVALLVWNTAFGPDSSVTLVTLLFAGSALAYGALAILMWHYFQRYDAHERAFSIIPTRLSDFGLAIAILIFVSTAGNQLTLMFHEFAMADPEMTISGGVDRREISNVDDFTEAGAAAWSIIILTLIAAPIVEEVLFRGWMLPMLVARGVPTLFAILISALAFGLLHLPQGLLVITSTFFLGMALGIARVVSGRVAAPVIGHMANNALALYVLPRLAEFQAG